MIKQKVTRVFFCVDSKENEPEIYETLEEAKEYLNSEYMKERKLKRIYIALVKNAYIEQEYSEITTEEDHIWNYDDFSDTFQIIKQLTK